MRKYCIRMVAAFVAVVILMALAAACDVDVTQFRIDNSSGGRDSSQGSSPGTTPGSPSSNSSGNSSGNPSSSSPGDSGGTSSGSASSGGDSGQSEGSGGADDTIGMELGPEMPPLTGPPAISIVLSPVASGVKVAENAKAVIDYSNTSDGYVMIKWIGGAVDVGLRVQIIGPGSTKFTYHLKADSQFEVFPLSDGSGNYNIVVANLLADGSGRASVAASADISAALTDEFAPFLRPNQYVNFDKNSKVVTKAAELVSAQADFISKISAIYNFVIKNITYDVDFANEVRAGKHSGYLPVLDSVLERKKGICFDFAAVMTAMLRSQGIPAKLVVGDVDGGLRHAWINVYSDTEGWINAVIYFDGRQWKMMDPTFDSSGTLRDYVGDGSNYQALWLY